MGWEGWYTLGVVALCFGLMAFSRAAPDVVMMGGLTLVFGAGVLTPAQALAGLSNDGMVTVAFLYIIVSGLRETGAIAWIVHGILGRPRTTARAQLRLMAPVAAMSAFLNNTPVVAIFIPAVHDWAKQHRLSVSRLMMPLSFAAMAGGTCTLIGTSTNLVVNGLLVSTQGQTGLGMFELAWVGVPFTLITLLYMVLVSPWLLPERRPAISQFENVREYTVEMLVEPGAPLVGKSVEEAGLRQLPGMYLVEIEREGQVIPAVSPQERLRADDRLVFAGVVESVIDLHKMRGLKPATDQIFKLTSAREDRALVEAVVSNSCPVVGKSIREGRFRTLYNAAVIAVARNGEKINKKLGDIVLRAGDTLLLEANPAFIEQQRNSRDFFLVSAVDGFTPPRHERGVMAIAILTAMVVTVAVGWVDILKASMLAAGLMIITRCTSGRSARRSIDWQVLVVIAASFGLGNALEASGAAGVIAADLVALAGNSPWVALGLVYVTTALFTAMVSNNAAAVVMFPIAVATAHGLHVSIMPFVITIMMAASASFATPIGYQTNLMIYGPGGYHFSDYFRLGIPLTLLSAATTIGLVPLVWHF